MSPTPKSELSVHVSNELGDERVGLFARHVTHGDGTIQVLPDAVQSPLNRHALTGYGPRLNHWRRHERTGRLSLSGSRATDDQACGKGRSCQGATAPAECGPGGLDPGHTDARLFFHRENVS